MKLMFWMMGAALCLAPSQFAWAQSPAPKLTCDQVKLISNGLVPYCEMREVSLPFTGSLAVKTGGSGNISIETWDGADVLVRAQVETAALNENLAKALTPLVIVDTSDGNVLGKGPALNEEQVWTLNFEIYVPRATALTVSTLCGRSTSRR